MEMKIVDLPAIAVIGKAGLCTPEKNVAQHLWREANAHFAEVAALGLKHPDGTYVGFWGAMSDEGMRFRPWTHRFTRGLYLAGVQTRADARAPEGWTKWIMPARKYAVADVAPNEYDKVFCEVVSRALAERGMKLAGTVCDYIEPATGQNRLYFPVEPL